MYTTGRRAHNSTGTQSTGPLPLPHTRDPSCRAPLTRDHPQACEPRCADVFKHYLACADRIEQKGAGAGAAFLNTAIVRHRRDRKPPQATASPTTSTGSSA